MTEQVIDAGTNADLVNRMVSEAVADSPQPAAASEPVVIRTPPDTEVELLVGLVNQLEGTTDKTAVVRELNGSDEEALSAPALVRSVPKYLNAIAVRGTETVGGQKASDNLIGGLLIGDREVLLLGIRRATYGDDLELITQCPNCKTVDEDFVYPLSSVPVRRLENEEDALYGFTLELPSGKKAHVNLPRAADQDALLLATDKNPGELNTMMLARCVQRLDEMPVMGEGQVKALSIRDREFIMKEINDRTPGPRLGEAKRTCGACEQEFELGIGLLDIFRV